MFLGHYGVAFAASARGAAHVAGRVRFRRAISPPPNERALAWTALGIWLFVPWAWWVDKHRDNVGRIKVPDERLTRA